MLSRKPHPRPDRRPRTRALLEQFVATFPARKKKMERLFREHGWDDTFDLTVGPPVPVSKLIMCDRKTTRPLSPMLRERFEFAGEIVYGGEVWVAADRVPAAMRIKGLVGNHKARREHWEGSAPMQFGDSRLSLFAYDPVSSEDVVYLVWPREAVEPEVWNYHSMDEARYENLDAYLRWVLA